MQDIQREYLRGVKKLDLFTYEQRSSVPVLFFGLFDRDIVDVNVAERQVYHLALYPTSKRSFIRKRYVAHMWFI